MAHLISKNKGQLTTTCAHVTYVSGIQDNTKRCPNAVLILAYPLRRWPDIETTMHPELVFTGMSSMLCT